MRPENANRPTRAPLASRSGALPLLPHSPNVPVARLLIALIRLYQWTLSPLLGNVCVHAVVLEVRGCLPRAARGRARRLAFDEAAG